MTETALRDQYQRLQEQQKRKLERLREINLRKSSSTGAIQIPQAFEEKETEGEATFGVDDDLGLDSQSIALSKYDEDQDERFSGASKHTYRKERHFTNPSLPARRNRQAIDNLYDEDRITEDDVIRQLKDENGRLYKLLSERDNDIKQLKSKFDMMRKTGMSNNLSLTTAGDSSSLGGDAAAVKIMSMSKKLREMTAELESEKSKVAQLKKKCHEMQQDQSQSTGFTKPPASPTVEQQKDEEMKQLRDKLKSTEAKMLEVRGQHQTTSHELKLAMKALSDEVGDKGGKLNLHEIISGQSDWRGRHQRIMTLQSKVHDLERQLKEYQFGSASLDTPDAMVSDQIDFSGATSLGRSGSIVSSNMSTISSAFGNSRNLRQRDAVIKMQKARQEALEKAETQLKHQSQEMEEVKKKQDASRARNKVLTTEMKALKEKIAVLLEKGHHDDELIATLLKQQSILQTTIQSLMERHAQTEVDSTNQVADLSVKKDQESRVVERLKEIIAEKERQIMELQQNVVTPQSPSNKRKNSDPVVKEPPLSVQSRAVSPFILTSRDPSGSLSSGRIKSAATDRAGINFCDQELRSLCSAAEVERDRLRELTVVQDRRYEDLISKQIKLEEENSVLRRRCATMERQIQKSSGKSHPTGSNSVVSFTDLSESDSLLKESLPVNQLSIDNLQNALSLSRDEVTALKQGLKRAMEAKREDLKMLTDIIGQTRDQFLQSIAHIRKLKVENS